MDMTSHPSESSSPRILVVDDDAPIRTLVARVLAHTGIKVEEAVDGEDALAKIADTEYDGMVLDLMMPRVSGYDVIAALNEREHMLARHIVVLTADGSSAVERVRTQVCHVLQKPFNVHDLVETVRTCVDRAEG